MEEKDTLNERLALVEQKLQDLAEQIRVINIAVSESFEFNKVLNDMVSHIHDVNLIEHRIMKNNLPYEILDPRNNNDEFFFPNIIDAETAIQEIIDGKKSIARFGDGEFATIAGEPRHSFQKVDSNLGKRLKEVLQSDIPDLLIGIADNYGNLNKYTDSAADGIRDYMNPDTRKNHMKLLSKNKVYYDAYLSRPYIIYRDNNTDAPRKRFCHLKQIWNQRNVIMIEGSQTRLGVGNDLFDNCASIRRILIPPKNAFDRYEDILKSALQNAEKDNLFLIAAGPSGGVFAYDLTLNGFQAVDIGHVDVEYEWFKKGTGKREPLKNKYTNEIIGQEEAEEIHDPVYESQIIDCFQ